MAAKGSAAMPRSGVRAIPFLILAVLVGAAMLVALLAMHAAGGALIAATGDSSRSSESSSGPALLVPTVPPAESGMIAQAAVVGLPTAAVALGTFAMTMAATGTAPECVRCLPDCAVIAMICVALLTVAALIGFGPPSLRHRVLRSTGVLVRRFVSAPPHIYRPSLTVLSISRT